MKTFEQYQKEVTFLIQIAESYDHKINNPQAAYILADFPEKLIHTIKKYKDITKEPYLKTAKKCIDLMRLRFDPQTNIKSFNF